MYWAQHGGLGRVVATMQQLAVTHGRRWDLRRCWKRAPQGAAGSERIRVIGVLGLLAVLAGPAQADTPPADTRAMAGVPRAWRSGQGARLYEGLGNFHRAVSTTVPLAQRC
jgi:hypothetical protein